MRKETPQEKKVLDYLNQSKNTYGEDSKGSRKSIHFRKAEVNRTYRRKITSDLKAIFNEQDEELVQNRISSIKRKYWKKYPDSPLIDTIALSYNINQHKNEYSPNSMLQNEAIKRRKQSKKS